MVRKSPTNRADPDHTVGGRLASALASLLFSLPVCGLLWLAINRGLADSNSLLPASALLWLVGLIALFAFGFPKLFPALFGWLCDAFFAIGKYW